MSRNYQKPPQKTKYLFSNIIYRFYRRDYRNSELGKNQNNQSGVTRAILRLKGGEKGGHANQGSTHNLLNRRVMPWLLQPQKKSVLVLGKRGKAPSNLAVLT